MQFSKEISAWIEEIHEKVEEIDTIVETLSTLRYCIDKALADKQRGIDPGCDLATLQHNYNSWMNALLEMYKRDTEGK